MSRLPRREWYGIEVEVMTGADLMRKLGIYVNKGGGIEPLPLSKPDALKDMRAVGLDV